jgi:hypothetical protein
MTYNAQPIPEEQKEIDALWGETLKGFVSFHERNMRDFELLRDIRAKYPNRCTLCVPPSTKERLLSNLKYFPNRWTFVLVREGLLYMRSRAAALLSCYQTKFGLQRAPVRTVRQLDVGGFHFNLIDSE